MDIGPISTTGKAALRADAVPTATSGASRTLPPVAAAITDKAVSGAGQAANNAPLGEALRSINAFLESNSSSLEFSLDQDSKRVIVKVVDAQTNDVIRQIPTEEAIEISKALDKLQGLLVNSQA